jgi:hypothetical protein
MSGAITCFPCPILTGLSPVLERQRWSTKVVGFLARMTLARASKAMASDFRCVFLSSVA